MLWRYIGGCCSPFISIWRCCALIIWRRSMCSWGIFRMSWSIWIRRLEPPVLCMRFVLITSCWLIISTLSVRFLMLPWMPVLVLRFMNRLVALLLILFPRICCPLIMGMRSRGCFTPCVGSCCLAMKGTRTIRQCWWISSKIINSGNWSTYPHLASSNGLRNSICLHSRLMCPPISSSSLAWSKVATW